jgi:hypothetical protein
MCDENIVLQLYMIISCSRPLEGLMWYLGILINLFTHLLCLSDLCIEPACVVL